VLTKQGDQLFAVGLTCQSPGTAGRGTGHRYPVGRTTTAVP
jgi:hypothetical protein